MLKKISWIFILLFTTACLAGCGDDNEHEDDTTVDTDYIVGKWQGVSSRGWEIVNGKITDRWEDNESSGLQFIEFKNDATGRYEDDEIDFPLVFTWNITGRNALNIAIAIGSETYPTTFKIKTLTHDKLVLAMEEGNSQNGSYTEDTYRRIN